MVPDIGAARAELLERGSERSETSGVLYASLGDPDDNGWTQQQLPY